MTDEQILATPFTVLRKAAKLEKDPGGLYRCPQCEFSTSHPVVMGKHRQSEHNYRSPVQRKIELSKNSSAARNKRSPKRGRKSPATPPQPTIDINYCPRCMFHLRPVLLATMFDQGQNHNGR